MAATIVAGARSRSSHPGRAATYTPAEAATRSGLTLDTLRYYERIGLVPPVARDGGGRRRYSERDLGRLALIRCLRDTRMPIADIKRVVSLVEAGPTSATNQIALLEAHDRAVDHQIEQLRRSQAYLRNKIASYRQQAIPAASPVPEPPR